MTQQYCLASKAAWLSSTGISHHSLLPHIPSVHLSAVNSSPRPGIAPQSLNSSSQLLHLSGGPASLPVVCMAAARTVLFLIPFRLPQISSFTVSLKCFSSDSDNCSDVGIGPLFLFPHAPRAGSVLLKLLFPPLPPAHPVASSYQVLCSSIYSFPLVRYSCLLSASVLHALPCLKVYS